MAVEQGPFLPSAHLSGTAHQQELNELCPSNFHWSCLAELTPCRKVYRLHSAWAPGVLFFRKHLRRSGWSQGLMATWAENELCDSGAEAVSAPCAPDQCHLVHRRSTSFILQTLGGPTQPSSHLVEQTVYYGQPMPTLQTFLEGS